MTAQLPFPTIPTPKAWDRSGLPAWTYHSRRCSTWSARSF